MVRHRSVIIINISISALTALFFIPLTATTATAQPKARFLVILDPGHGGEDTGAISKHAGRDIYEKDLTLAIARHVAKSLKARHVPVAFTRTEDRFVALDQRTEAANQAASKALATVFVSIHLNSISDAGSSGAELYIFNATTNEAARRLADIENGISHADPGRRAAQMTQNHGTLDLIFSDLATTANYGDSVNLACSLRQAIWHGPPGRRYGIRDRGIRQALFYVLMETHMPGVLFEAGFMSNEQELSRLLSPSYQQSLAHSLADGIVHWRREALLAAHAKRKDGRAISAIAKPNPTCRIASH